MPSGDAVQKQPTIEEQIAKFQGFATTNGEVSDGEPVEEPDTGQESPEAPASEEEAPEKDEAAEGAEKAAAKAPKPKKTAEERIAEVTRKWRAEQRERATETQVLRDRLAALERGDTKGLTGDKSAAKDGPPNPAKFTYGELDAEYIRALARYETKQEIAASQKETKEAQQREAASREQRELAKQAEALIAKGTALHDDFEEVVMDGARNGEWPLSDALGKLLLTSEHGAAIAYHLATHYDEAETVFGKSPLEQAAWLGRQEAKLSSASPDAPAKAAVKVTKAPNPPAIKARGAGGNSGTVAEDTNDFSAFERRWKAENLGA